MIAANGNCTECFREFDLEVEKEMFGDKGLKEGSPCPSDDCPSHEKEIDQLPLITDKSPLALQLALMSSLRSIFTYGDQNYGNWLYETLHHLATSKQDAIIPTVSDMNFPLASFASDYAQNNVSRLYALLVVLLRNAESAIALQHEVMFDDSFNPFETIGVIIECDGALRRFLPSGSLTDVTAPLISEREFIAACFPYDEPQGDFVDEIISTFEQKSHT